MTDTERCAMQYFIHQLYCGGYSWSEATSRTTCKFPIQPERLAQLYNEIQESTKEYIHDYGPRSTKLDA